MAEVEINGGRVVYEFIGPAEGVVVVLTPGGRFGKDHGGVRELGEALAAGGHRVLLWDRPNCGASDVQLFGRTESHMRAETLGALLEILDTGPVVAAGGSGGARDMIIFADLYPHLPFADFSHDLLTPASGLQLYTWPDSVGWTDLGTPGRLETWLVEQARVSRPASVRADYPTAGGLVSAA